eukprot:2753628-Pyramimonas_sp.AAC.1
MLPFALDMLGRHGGSARFGSPLIHAGAPLEAFLSEMRSHTCVVPTSSIAIMTNAIIIHMRS